MKGIHHPKGNVHGIYLHQSKDSHGLTGMEDTHNCTCAALAAYVCTNTDILTQIMHDTPTPNQKFLLKFATPEITDDTHYQCLKAKPLHGKFFKQQEETPKVD
eukprot:12799930-Ditylum_brightwellii.AAC.1